MVYPKIDTIKHAYDWQHPSNSYFLAAIPINLISVVSSLTAREPSASLVTPPLPNRLLWITGSTATVAAPPTLNGLARLPSSAAVVRGSNGAS